MKKAVVLFLHFGYWFLYLLLLTMILAITNSQLKRTPQIPNLITIFPLIIFCIVPNLFAFYSFYFFLFPAFLFRQRIFALLLSGVFVCLVSAFLCSLFSLFLIGLDQPVFAEKSEFIMLNGSLFLIAAVHGTIALVIRGFITWYDEIKLKETLAQKNYEMELALIKSQINPHFLFNTINNIDVLISKDAAKASEYLNKLSDIMRYMVYETKTEKILLEREISYIEKYLELQKIRTSNPQYVNYEVTGSPNNLMLAPMILFPFIENAFKHTENKKNSNSIDIKLSIEKGKLAFECENSHQKNAGIKQDFGGLGNELIQKRLVLMYPDKHILKIIDEGGIYKVKLILDLYEN